jgi:hypothetical protein
VALILVVASDDGFAILVMSLMIQPDQTGTSATGC